MKMNLRLDILLIWLKTPPNLWVQTHPSATGTHFVVELMCVFNGRSCQREELVDAMKWSVKSWRLTNTSDDGHINEASVLLQTSLLVERLELSRLKVCWHQCFTLPLSFHFPHYYFCFNSFFLCGRCMHFLNHQCWHPIAQSAKCQLKLIHFATHLLWLDPVAKLKAAQMKMPTLFCC